MLALNYLYYLLSVFGALTPRRLALELSGSFDDPHSVIVTATFTNTGRETLALSNTHAYADSLSTVFTDAFSVVDEYGHTLSFTASCGTILPHTPKHQTSSTALRPGESFSEDCLLSIAHNFGISGEQIFAIQPVSSAILLKTSPNAKRVVVDISQGVISINIGSLLSSPSSQVILGTDHSSPSLAGPHFINCSSKQEASIARAALSAQSYAGESLTYLKNIGEGTKRYTTWYGAYSPENHAILTSHFTNVAAHNFSTGTYNCNCKDNHRWAYTNPDDTGKIWLCNAFWKSPITGSNSQAGTLIHESTHWNAVAFSKDYEVGRANCTKLAQEEPNLAIWNSDNHEYFAENTPIES